MNPRLQAFQSALDRLNPATNDYLVADLNELIEPLENDPTVSELFPAMFQAMETYPEADFGLPGPLVHLLESHPGQYEDLLLASLHRTPTIYTLQMVNRLLNTDLSPADREKWLHLLQQVAGDPRWPADVGEQATHFLDFQLGNL